MRIFAIFKFTSLPSNTGKIYYSVIVAVVVISADVCTIFHISIDQCNIANIEFCYDKTERIFFLR